MNLLELYNTKTYNTDKESLHCYISEYYNHTFTPYKESNIKLLEIGIRYGGSIELWRDFFTNAIIYGIDSGEEAITNVDNCIIINDNAYDINVINALPIDFDFIIDDGPHTLISQIKFIVLYRDKIKKGGHLIIEDIQSYENLMELIKYINTDLFSYKVLDLRGVKGKYDDIILDILKK
jgi:hypothetical protein